VLTLVTTALGAPYQHGSLPHCIPLTWRRLKRGVGGSKVNSRRLPVPRARVFMTTPGAVTAQTKRNDSLIGLKEAKSNVNSREGF
jgi:hypothetical protein